MSSRVQALSFSFQVHCQQTLQLAIIIRSIKIRNRSQQYQQSDFVESSTETMPEEKERKASKPTDEGSLSRLYFEEMRDQALKHFKAKGSLLVRAHDSLDRSRKEGSPPCELYGLEQVLCAKASPVTRTVAHPGEDYDDPEYEAVRDAMAASEASTPGVIRVPPHTGQQPTAVVTALEGRSTPSSTIPTDDNLIEATLVPDGEVHPDFEDVLAERDALRRAMESIHHAKGEAEVGPERSRKNLVIFLLMALVITGGIVGTSLSAKNNNYSTPSYSVNADNAGKIKKRASESFWIAKQIGDTIYGAEAFDEFGEHLSLSSDGQRLAVGGEEHASFAGRASVYELVSSSDQTMIGKKQWQPLGQDILGANLGDESGRVTLSGDGRFLAVGGMKATTDQGGEKSGQVRTFRFSPDQSSWIPAGQVLGGHHANQRFGTTVKFSEDGMILAVGAPGTNLEANKNIKTVGVDSGSVQVFHYNQTTDRWIPLGQELKADRETTYFGFIAAFSDDGHVLATGGYGYNENGKARSGMIRVYEYNEESMIWMQRGQDFYGENASDEVGRSVSLSSDGRTLAFGAFKHGITNITTETGRVYVYQWDDNRNWKQIGSSIDGISSGDRLGRSVALSGDGSVLVAGAYWNNDGGNRAGHVRVFQKNTDTTTTGNLTDEPSWEQVGPPIIGESGDWFGRTLDISKDGQTLTIGGPFNDGVNGEKEQSGKVEVYSLPL